LEFLGGTRKILVTKHALSKMQNRKLEKEAKYQLHNQEETLDGEDLFQSEGFSLNIEDLNTIQFHFHSGDDDDYLERSTYEQISQIQHEGFSEKLEKAFQDEAFDVTLTEKKATRIIGSVKLMNGIYYVSDAKGSYLFQIEKIFPSYRDRKIKVIRKMDEEDMEEEMGSIEFGPLNGLTVETEVIFSDMCSSKEKLLILGTVLALLMKCPFGRRNFDPMNDRRVCSITGLWRGLIQSIRSPY